ncbi:MAG: beta-mannanase [Actinobacteria bacterium]|nr:beta-mannanase [Actinomycetota bacterium]
MVPIGRSRRPMVGLVAIVVALLAAAAVVLALAPSSKSEGRAYWGAWIGDQLTGHEAPWDMSAVHGFAAEVGKAPSLIEFSSPFAECSATSCTSDPFPTTPMEAIRAYGAIPFFSWSSQSLPSRTNGPQYRLAAIAAGSQDPYIREFAQAAAAWGHPFFLRFDWEMNGNWFPWGVGANGNTPADYVYAWRRVHQIFAEAGATDVTWVWCPYVDPGGTLADLAQLYPGDDYVDWTCLDGYNWGPDSPSPRRWQSFSHLFGSTYKEITETVAPSKPMLVAETASSEHGGSKAEWIARAFAALPEEFPRIQGLIWFDKVDDGMDWPLESSSGATSGFAAGIADSRYVTNEFADLAESPISPP